MTLTVNQKKYFPVEIKSISSVITWKISSINLANIDPALGGWKGVDDEGSGVSTPVVIPVISTVAESLFSLLSSVLVSGETALAATSLTVT